MPKITQEKSSMVVWIFNELQKFSLMNTYIAKLITSYLYIYIGSPKKICVSLN